MSYALKVNGAPTNENEWNRYNVSDGDRDTKWENEIGRLHSTDMDKCVTPNKKDIRSG